ncbi:hypothetical protein J5M93_004523 [Salmonella enterica]|nr:hypothetical protein [Salmonella enterica]
MDKDIILNEFKGIVVLDRYGTGKTTFINEILEANENFIYLGDMVSETTLNHFIDTGKFILMEHARLSENEFDRFKRKGFFIGSIESVKKLMEENNANNVKNEGIELIKIFEDIEIKMKKKRI